MNLDCIPFNQRSAAQNMKIDLNLFTVFDTIYSEGSLTRAAERLNLTQPAISHALGRLRDRLQDPLFIRHGHKMTPTPLAQNLLPEIRQALTQLNQAVQKAHAFDPLLAKKTFRMAMRDVIEATLLPPLIKGLAESGPNINLASVRIDRKELEVKLAAGELDFAVDVLVPTSANLKHQKLVDDELVVVIRKQHPLLHGSYPPQQNEADKGAQINVKLTADQYLRCGHVQVSGRPTGPGLEDFALSKSGYNRNIRLRCQHYYAACRVVESSDLLLTMPARYAQLLIASFPELSIVSCPFSSDAIDVHLYWHVSRDNDSANRWFREYLLPQIATPLPTDY